MIHPTGTGKSFIGFKLCEEHPDKKICWLSPSRYIYDTQLENLAESSAGYSPENIEFITYVRGDRKALYSIEEGKSSPTEILEALNAFNAEGRPIWKPMHLQPMYRGNEFITVNGRSRGSSDAYIEHGKNVEVTTDIFNHGLCLPSDNKQTKEQAEVIIEVVKRCFG